MPADCASLVYSSKIEVYQNRIDNFLYFLKKKKISKASYFKESARRKHDNDDDKF